MPRVVHFDIPVDDPARAVDFYTGVFGWKITKWEGPMDYWLVQTGEGDEPGINGGISVREEPVKTVENTIQVPSIDDYVKRVTDAGGELLMAKSAIPSVGWFAMCKDTEGNKFGLMQPDESAK